MPGLQHRDDLIIIVSSLGRVLRGGVNAQWVKALLGDMEHFVVLRDSKVFMGSARWGTAKAALACKRNAPERTAAVVFVVCLFYFHTLHWLSYLWQISLKIMGH